VREKLTETIYKTSEADFQIIQKKYQSMLWKETDFCAQSMILRNEHWVTSKSPSGSLYLEPDFLIIDLEMSKIKDH